MGNRVVKTRANNPSYADRGELFDARFSKALDALLEEVKLKKLGPKKYSKTGKGRKKKPVFAVEDDKLAIARLKADEETEKTKGRKIASLRRSGKGSNKLRTGLLFVLLVTLVGGFINYYGIAGFSKLNGSLRSIRNEIPTIVNLGNLVGSLTSLKIENVLPHAGRKEPVKKDNKPLKHIVHFQKRGDSDKAELFPTEQALSYPYSIHLGSYRTLERARKAMSEYRKKGLFPYWVKVNLGENGVWFRVFTGYFQNRKQAEAYINEKQIEEAKTRHTKYANLIGIYKSPVELKSKRLALLELGYCPYVIVGTDGKSLLYTGAFYQRAGADEQHANLASNGIQGQLVER
ncbi:MAG: SPOR domain-containing protein [Deltaproteobacteria bacterium]|nr:MAG: SPOR domain-containing protein [Deltaproteobacteria bacterium]